MDDKKNEKEPEMISTDNKKKQNRQILWTIVLMTSIILIIIIVPIIANIFFNRFTYINLNWQKTRLGDLVFYSISVPVADVTGNVIDSYTMNFRSDPRNLEYVPVDAANDTISFMRTQNGFNPVYITLDPDMESCEGDNTIALVNLAGFLRDFGGMNVGSAVSDEDYARENNLTYMACGSPVYNVIKIQSGNETRIDQISGSCYEITYKDCEIIPATEKFMLNILGNYMTYFEK